MELISLLQERETYQTHKTYQRDEVKGPSGHIIREMTTETDTRTGRHTVKQNVYNVGGAQEQSLKQNVSEKIN